MKFTRTTRNAGWLVVAGLLGAALIAPAGVSATDPLPATVTGHMAGSAERNHASYWENLWKEDCTKLDIHRYKPDGGLAEDNQEIASYLLDSNYSHVVVKAESGEFANTIFEDASAGEFVWADTNGDSQYNPGGQDGDKNISHIIRCDPSETTTTTSSIDTTEQTTTGQTTTGQTTTGQTTTGQTTTGQTTTGQTTTETTETTVTGTVSGETTDTETTETTVTGTVSGETTDTETTETTVSGTVGGETGEPTPPSTDTADFASTSSTTGSGWGLLLVAMAGLLAAALLLTPAAEARKR